MIGVDWVTYDLYDTGCSVSWRLGLRRTVGREINQSTGLLHFCLIISIFSIKSTAMRNFSIVVCLLILFSSTSFCPPNTVLDYGRCVGSASCRACSSCSSCKYCSSGGTCGVCAAPEKPTKREPTKRSSQCQATTKKGTQCSRAAKAGSSYCWQHAK